MCVAAVVALAVAIWSWLRQPAPMHVSTAPGAAAPAPIDLARRAAAIALARMPDEDPWAYAEKVAASSASAPKSTCGTDEVPQSGEPQRVDGQVISLPEKPAGPGYVAAVRRIDQALRASNDPFDRAVADALDVDGSLAGTARLDALIEDAIDSSDPRIYAMAYGNCFGGGVSYEGCRRLSARQWANLDPGNAQPWLSVFNEAKAAGDASTQQEALTQMAAASRFDSRYLAAAGAVARQWSGNDGELAATDAVAGQATAVSGSLPTFGPLIDACRAKAGGDVNRAQQCQRVSDVVFDHGDTLVARAMGGVLYMQATGDTSRRDLSRAERAVLNAHWSPATGFSECAAVRDSLRSMLRGAQLGELEAARERSRTFVTP